MAKPMSRFCYKKGLICQSSTCELHGCGHKRTDQNYPKHIQVIDSPKAVKALECVDKLSTILNPSLNPWLDGDRVYKARLVLRKYGFLNN